MEWNERYFGSGEEGFQRISASSGMRFSGYPAVGLKVWRVKAAASFFLPEEGSEERFSRISRRFTRSAVLGPIFQQPFRFRVVRIFRKIRAVAPAISRDCFPEAVQRDDFRPCQIGLQKRIVCETADIPRDAF